MFYRPKIHSSIQSLDANDSGKFIKMETIKVTDASKEFRSGAETKVVLDKFNMNVSKGAM